MRGKKLSKKTIQKNVESHKINKEIREGKRPAPILPFCACGCGGRVTKPRNKYITGHNTQGKNNPMYGVDPWIKGLTKETDKKVMEISKKISKTKIDFYQTDEGQQWLDDHNRGINHPSFGLEPWIKGLTKETDIRVKKLGEKGGKNRIDFYQTKEGQKYIDEHFRGENSPLYGKKPWNFGLTKDTDERVEEIAKNISIGRKRFFQSEKGQQWINDNLKGENNRYYGKQLSEEHLRKILKAVCAKPNKPEQHLERLLNEIFPNEYKFVGDGSVIIGGCSPDFINTNGQKKLIEMFGDYWHRNDDEGNRIFQFKLFGFDTLVVWEHELHDNEIEMTIAKIIEFHYRDKK